MRIARPKNLVISALIASFLMQPVSTAVAAERAARVANAIYAVDTQAAIAQGEQIGIDASEPSPDAPAPVVPDAPASASAPEAVPLPSVAPAHEPRRAVLSLGELDGRDFIGQSVAHIDGRDYILIGSEAQLRAIGSDKLVANGPVYAIDQVWVDDGFAKGHWEDAKDAVPRLVYAGDTELASGEQLHDAKFSDHDGGGAFQYTRVKYFTVDDSGRRDDIDRVNCGLKYSADADYLIFRDIKLTGAWTPLMFSSTMLGARSSAPEQAGSLWSALDADGRVREGAGAPVIADIDVRGEGKLSIAEQSGVGFFGTIGSDYHDEDLFARPGTARVSNIALENVSVVNAHTGVHVDQTLVSGLVGLLGGLIGGLTSIILGPILALLGVPDLGKLVTNLLTVRAADPTSLATGAFAGRIAGAVEIDRVSVDGASVSSAHEHTGGFVGHVSGETLYGPVSGLLGTLVKLVVGILNIIPGVGLGDVVKLLLDANVIKASQLGPIDYINPTIDDCSVSFSQKDALGRAESDFVGGFAGDARGAVFTGCSVMNRPAIVGRAYVGGFGGLMRDDVMRGALKQLGVDLIRLAQPASLALNCHTRGDADVTGATYVGGFSGAMAASYAIDCSTSVARVSSTGMEVEIGKHMRHRAYAGGFTGAATVGWTTDLGRGESASDNLLSGVNSLLNGLLTDDPDAAQDLLSLVGITPSHLLGTRVEATAVSAAGDCAGGIVGRGDGTVIAISDAAHLSAVPMVEHGLVAPVARDARSSVRVDKVVSDASCAGGAAGMLGVASIGGILNKTLSIGGFIAPTVSGTDVIAGSVTAAGECAGGLVGRATGMRVGRADKAYASAAAAPAGAVVSVGGLALVTAASGAGGAVGAAGPGELAATGGLDLLGLGLIQANGLLGAGAGLECKLDGVRVDGSNLGVSSTRAFDAGDTHMPVCGGFIGEADSIEMSDCHVAGLASVSGAGACGGFVGTSRTGGLADVADADAISGIVTDKDTGLISIDNLLSAVGYLVPSYTACDVAFVDTESEDDATVSGRVAGGFAGDMRSGEVSGRAESPWAVTGLRRVDAVTHGGGFAGRVTSGALADAAGGISILGGLADLQIGASGLASLLQVYVPTIERAGVASNGGLTVHVSDIDALDTSSGAAGGFIGYGSGVQVIDSDVAHLAHTTVTDPKRLDDADGASYFDARSEYAVSAPAYAGGFIGLMDIGSAASVGDGLNVLGKNVQLTDIVSALSVVTSTAAHADVISAPGGASVLAHGRDANGDAIGCAGGWAGAIRGGHVQDCDADGLSHVIGQVGAGGHTASMEPGEVARLMGGNTSILSGLVSTSGALAQVLRDFVPTLRNSRASFTPCGGVVRAQAASDGAILRGVAGGYVGMNAGGHIWGDNRAYWAGESDKAGAYTGEVKRAEARRVRMVYGAEVAGGLVGLSEPADTAKTGSLSLLFGLIKVDNLIGALQVAYPTIESVGVTGPLRGTSVDTWNAWVDTVGGHGPYGDDFAGTSFATQDELDAFLEGYVFGTDVVSGRAVADTASAASRGGVAGGLVGYMHGGTMTDAHALDTRRVRALSCAGGAIGRADTADTVRLGGIDVLGLIDVNLGSLLSALDVLVPVVKSCSVTGYRRGMDVRSTDASRVGESGYAGGFVGLASGAQIWGDANREGVAASGCYAANVRRVTAADCAGGFAGALMPAGMAEVNTSNASEGLLQKLLDRIISTPQSVASVLEACVSTARDISVSAPVTDAGPSWGFVVEGSDAVRPRCAGGLIGMAKAAVIGRDGGSLETTGATVTGLRRVDADQFAGGLIGMSDAGATASVGGGEDGDKSTGLLLDLLRAGNISALEAYRTYLYDASLDGAADGATIQASAAAREGILDAKRYTGAAGGGFGALINGSAKRVDVRGLREVAGVNYAGGFVGHMGRGSTVDADNVGAAGLVGATAGVLDIWGSHIDDAHVTGVDDGLYVHVSHKGADYGAGTDAATGREVAGGFVGLADLARVSASTVDNLELVESGEIAGGFSGEATRAHLVETQATSPILDVLLKVVNMILKVLYVDGLQGLGLIDIGSLLGTGKVFDIKLLADGQTAYVNLFGLKVGVALSRADAENQQQTDVAIITIGDSVVKLPCSKEGVDADAARSNLTVRLIKANRATIQDCVSSGVATGYDVFGGHATQDGPGTGKLAFAGGFSGRNDEGVIARCRASRVDAVRGGARKTDPFSNTVLMSAWDFNSMSDIIGVDDGGYNVYEVHRPTEGRAVASDGREIACAVRDGVTGLSRYDVQVFDVVNCYDDDAASSGAAGDADTRWVGIKGADIAGGGSRRDMGVYVDASQALMMRDTRADIAVPPAVPEPEAGQDPCATTIDLRIAKVFDDGDGAPSRPKAVRMRVEGSYAGDDGARVVPDSLAGEPNPRMVDVSGSGATWSLVVEGLPVAVRDPSGTVRRLSYKVSEVSVIDADDREVAIADTVYSVSYDVAADGTAVTVTNTYRPSLPDAGGIGTWAFTVVGAMLIAIALARRRRTRPSAPVA